MRLPFKTLCQQLCACLLVAVGRERIPVDLSHQGAHDRRTGWHLHYLEPDTVLLQWRQQFPQAQHHRVGLVLPLQLVHQGQAQIGQVRCLALVVATHHAVEVNRRGLTDERCHRLYFGHSQQGLGHPLGHRGGRLQGGRLRHIHQHLHLVLVVIGQQLQGHQPTQTTSLARRRLASSGRSQRA